MNDILKRAAARADRAELYHLQQRSLPVTFDAQGLSVIKARRTEGVALRTIDRGRLGYATTTDLQHPEAVVDAALATAIFGEVVDLDMPAQSPRVDGGRLSTGTATPSPERLIELGMAIRERIAEDNESAELGLEIQSTQDCVRVANTAGLAFEETQSFVEISIEATLAQDDDIYTVSDSHVISDVDTASVDDITQRIRWLLAAGRDVVSAPSGTLPVVFTPHGALAVLLPVASGLSGKSVLLGTSPLGDKLGQPIFDERVCLTDDGSCEGGKRWGSADDEGVASCRTGLVSEGVLSSFYYDLRTAKQAETQSTGNGIKGGFFGGRDFRPAPQPNLSHLILGEGGRCFDELISTISSGLVVDTVMGLGQGNVMAGDFSNNVSAAFLIQDGKMAGRVKNVMIAGNSYQLLKDHLIGLSDRSQWIYGRFRFPALALDGLHVASK